MRKVEFRAWDKLHGRLAKVIMIDFDFDRVTLEDSADLWRIDFENIILEQYTGLHDKNGKKIFEGDLVKYGCGLTNVGKVVFDGKFGYSIEYRISDGHVIRQRQESFADIQSQIEVIRDIHQNMDLLEG